MSIESSQLDPYGSYYDPSPPQNLSRPVAVCGFFGCEGSLVAKRIAALGGWPHIDIYEQTAHKLGEHRAVAGISIENPGWSSVEEDCIERALRTQPHAIVGLTDGFLPPPRTLDLLNRFAHVVHVRWDWLDLQRNLLDELDAEPERFPEFMEHNIPDLHTLQLLHQQREPFYRTADITINATGISQTIAAQRITAAINTLV